MIDIARYHRLKFGENPDVVVRAPGRVNIIGDHTDYNDGFVLPMAIDRYVWIAVSRRKDQYLHMYSIDRDDLKHVNIQNIRFKKEDRWANYIKGVVQIFAKRRHRLTGMNLSITGNIPEGAGLSSSAALESGVAFAINTLFQLNIEREQLALIAMEAENNFVGVQCGIMDQFISLLGKEGHVMFLDTRSLDYEMIPLELNGAELVITNSNVPRGLVDSEYNERRKACEQCVEILKTKRKGIKLRDYSPSDLQEIMGMIPESVRKKGLHVVEENQRVIEAKTAILKGDMALLGRLMNRSHESLRDLFEVSCPELDWLVKRAWETDGVYGSRMTGAGFGGCTVTLIDSKKYQNYEEAIQPYERIFGFHPDIFTTIPVNGAEVVES